MPELKKQIAPLDSQQLEMLLYAATCGVPVIIDGDRRHPTGKSTLCEELKNRGVLAVERWELEEGAKKLNVPQNSLCVTVQLNRPLF